MFVNLCRLLREKLHLGGNPSPPNPPLEGEGSKALEPSPSRGGQGGDGVATGIDWTPRIDTTLKEPRATVLIPGARIRYLAAIAEQGRRSEEHTSELQSLMRISYAVFCLTKKPTQ